MRPPRNLSQGDMIDVTIRIYFERFDDDGVYWAHHPGGYRLWLDDRLIRKVRKVRRGARERSEG